MLQPALRRPPWRLLPIVSTALALTGCATLRLADAPGCSGPRRTANTHGSVLTSEPAQSPAPPTSGAGQCAGPGR